MNRSACCLCLALMLAAGPAKTRALAAGAKANLSARRSLPTGLAVLSRLAATRPAALAPAARAFAIARFDAPASVPARRAMIVAVSNAEPLTSAATLSRVSSILRVAIHPEAAEALDLAFDFRRSRRTSTVVMARLSASAASARLQPRPQASPLLTPKNEPASAPLRLFFAPLAIGIGMTRAVAAPIATLPFARLFLAPLSLGMDLTEDYLAPLLGIDTAREENLGSDIYQLAVFQERAGWTLVDANPRFEQRYRLEGQRIYTETNGVVHADVAAIREQLRSRWDWYRNGSYEKRRVLPDGRISYTMWPGGKMWGAGIYVNANIHPPESLPGGGERLRLELRGHVNGTAYFEIRPRPDGSSTLIGRFAGTRIAGLLPRLLGAERVARNHLLAESGMLDFPFPPGTGLIGLIERVESRR